MANDTGVNKKSPDSVQHAMLMVLAAMAPCFMMSTYIFGVEVPLLMGVCVFSAVLFEWAYEKIMKKPNTIFDYSAMVTGAIIAFGLPSIFPLWMAVIGTFIAIVIVKQLPGGFGKNKVNPALMAHIALTFLFSKQITTWPLNDFVKTAEDSAEQMTGLAPLEILAEDGDLPGLARLFMGFISGPCGEVSAAAVLIGGVYLIWKKVISPVIPISILGTVFLFALVFYGAKQGMADGFYMACFHLFAGGVMFSAFFCATDRVTSPGKLKPQIIYGICIGLITMIVRTSGLYPEGISLAIVLMNLAAPYLDRINFKKIEKAE